MKMVDFFSLRLEIQRDKKLKVGSNSIIDMWLFSSNSIIDMWLFSQSKPVLTGYEAQHCCLWERSSPRNTLRGEGDHCHKNEGKRGYKLYC